MPEFIQNPDTNIAEFSIEPAIESTARFIAEREITSQDWSALLERLDQWRTETINTSWDGEHLAALYAMVNLFPRRRDELRLSQKDEERIMKHLKGLILGIGLDEYIEDFISGIVQHDFLFPESPSARSLITPEIWKDSGVTKINSRLEGDWGNYARLAINLDILNPTDETAHVPLEDEDIDSIKTWGQSNIILLYLKLIEEATNPEVLEQILTDEYWEGLHEGLEQYRGDMKSGADGNDFVERAFVMKVLAAPKAEITDGRIVIGESVLDDSTTPPEPIQRSF
jgi:hypothetical protein